MIEDPVVELFSGSLWEAELIQTLLNERGIDCFIKNSTLNSYVYEPVYSSGVKIMILKSDLEQGNVVVSEFWRNNK